MGILIIEDDEDKLSNIQSFVQSEYPNLEITVARSFASGLRSIIKGGNELKLILMDMSMPSFDITEDEPSGGVPENFAGRDLLAQMRLRSVLVPTIVVTMFDSFGAKSNRMSIGELTEELRASYAPPFFDLVYYDSRQEGWQSALRESMSKAFRSRN